MSNQANPQLELVEKIFKSLVWDTLIEAGLAALFTAMPGLNIWPIRTILSGFIHLFSDRLFGVLKLTVDLQAIAFVNEAHKKAFDNEAVKLKILAKDRGIDSPEFKEARDDAKVVLSQYVHFSA